MMNFPDERMAFDLDKGLRITDDGSEIAAKKILSALHFMSDYMANGKLLAFNADHGTLLGRKDAYIPMNIIPGLAIDHFNQLIAKYEAEAETRAAAARQKAGGA